MNTQNDEGNCFKAYTADRFRQTDYWNLFSVDQQQVFNITTKILPFRVNDYVLDMLIDWDNLDNDPMFHLLFPQMNMLTTRQFAMVANAIGKGKMELADRVRQIRAELNPHPAGQMTHNGAHMGNDIVPGAQHKYHQTALLFPSAGQTCHAYCSFCFRWPQFIGDSSLKIQARETYQLVEYLKKHDEITDVLITGGDPMVMNSKMLRRYIEPLLAIDTVRTIRIGSKAISYWPTRFTSGDNAGDLLKLFSQIVDSGRHLAFMMHLNHRRELMPDPARKAIRAIQSTGALIRTQGPVLRHINDSSKTWVNLWEEAVRLGCSPDYMFIERDTGPCRYFQVPLVRAAEIYQKASQQVSGLARSARGPVMSTLPGKILVDGIVTIEGRQALSLRLIQARDPSLAFTPFLAEYDPEAVWIDDLKPFDQPGFPYQVGKRKAA